MKTWHVGLGLLGLVAVLIVNGLEMIQVEQHYGETSAGTA